LQTSFIGENLLPGNIGHLMSITAFIASIVAALAYFFSAQAKDAVTASSWKLLGRNAFMVHFAGVLGVFSILFYLIFNHRFEYHYVWSHSSNALPFKYLLSCFWEGQEGSFLLWLIWHGTIGSIVLFNAKKWEAPVMSVISFVQIFLSATILGIYFFEAKFGSSPFTLLRNQMQGAPIFQQPNYLEFIKDGNGLNPLLQNYWMVIHPPILFLGFASTLIPFAYAIAGIWKKDFTDWVKPALAWGIFGVMILGTGIMMGGAWAYESLSFGGYWAWDPVENASLVPWLTLVAGVHTLNIYKHSQYSLKTALGFFILTFFLIIYSTYLTRTGILGETSVHAFTGEGASLSIHLILFLATIAIGSTALFIYNRKQIPSIVNEEEANWSREFWLYIGALVLLISAIQITFTTSIPVWNKIFNFKDKLAPPADPMAHYNQIQIWIAIIIALGTAFTMFLKYKNTNIKDSLMKQLIPLILSIALTIALAYGQNIKVSQPLVLLFASCYAVIGNLFFLIRLKINDLTKWGASVAHIGFGLMLLGILFSSFNKHVISKNKLKVDLGLGGKTDDEKFKENNENVLLYRSTPVDMEQYTITYNGDSVEQPNHWYKIKYEEKEPGTGKVLETFYLYPNAQINPKMGLVSSPGTKHYWNKDVFTYITKTLDKSTITDTFSYSKRTLKIGDTLYFNNGYLVYDKLERNITNPAYKPELNDIAVAANLAAYNINGKVADVQPVYFIRGNIENRTDDTLKDYNLYVRLAKLNMDSNKSVDIEFKQPAAENDYIVMKALVFPHINVLWIGTVIMVLGTFLALWRRIKQSK
jgi:cytochrome c-type biogenesis protein CcmF